MNPAAISLEIKLLRGLIKKVELYDSTQTLPENVKASVAVYLKVEIGQLPNIKTIQKKLGAILQGLKAELVVAKAEAEAKSKSKNEEGPP
jgi:hypothetical protein